MLANKFDISGVLADFTASQSLIELLPRCESLMPEGNKFNDDTWDILPWMKRKGNSRIFNISFAEYGNQGLKNLAKIHILHKRLTKQIGGRAALMSASAIKELDKIIWQKDVREINNADFYRTEANIKKTSESPSRLCHQLMNFGEWLNYQLYIPISYTPKVKNVYKHGRRGPESGREQKLLHPEIISEMIAANTRTGLSQKDQFFLSVFVIMTATGFRINELATLPLNCLEKIDGQWGINYYPEKVWRLGRRLISQKIVPAVQAAINHIIAITDPGREAVRELRDTSKLDWFGVLEDGLATEYFVAQFCHVWTSKYKLINPDGAWLNKEQRYVDVLSLVESEGSKLAASRKLGVNRSTMDGLVVAQQNARKGLLPNVIASRGANTRTTWDTDSRVISLLKFMKHCGIQLTKKRDRCQHIINDAMQMQLKGQVYPLPPYSAKLEAKFRRKIRPVIVDGRNKSILEPEDALFVIPRYFFSEARSTKDGDYRLITDKAIGRWLNGEGRSHGTGNHEDSCFVRLGINDPKTGEPAKFTTHDVRHWLNTVYAEGHVDEDTIALIFSRKKGSNHVYDQTSKKVRLENLRQSVRNGGQMGYLSANYSRLAEFSREDAERYLIANTLMVNFMPHGVCSLSWGMKSCPNFLSCFSGENGKPCGHLHVDCTDEQQVHEMKAIDRELASTLDRMPEASPQFEHIRNIKITVEGLLAGEVTHG